MDGWIKIHRQIRDHWIWNDPVKTHRWLDILLDVNHQGKKVNIGNELYECRQGQTVRSLRGWADRWGVSKDSARAFLRLLESDGMIRHENLKKTTRVTVCNYDIYQTGRHDQKTQERHKPKANRKQTGTNKNVKNVKNNNIIERKEIFKSQVWEYQDKYSGEILAEFFEYWTEHGENDKKMRFEKENTWGLSRRLSTWEKNSKKFKGSGGDGKQKSKGVNSYWNRDPQQKGDDDIPGGKPKVNGTGVIRVNQYWDQ